MARFILWLQFLIQLLRERDGQWPGCFCCFLLHWFAGCGLLLGSFLSLFLCRLFSFRSEQVHQMGLHGKPRLDRISGGIGLDC